EPKATSKAGRGPAVGRRKTAGSGEVVAPRKTAGRRKAARVEAESETPVEAANPVAPEPGEIEALAEAADTFEQAFEERQTPVHSSISVPELRVPETPASEERHTGRSEEGAPSAA